MQDSMFLTGQQNREHMQAPKGNGDDPEVCFGKTELIHKMHLHNLILEARPGMGGRGVTCHLSEC